MHRPKHPQAPLLESLLYAQKTVQRGVPRMHWDTLKGSECIVTLFCSQNIIREHKNKSKLVLSMISRRTLTRETKRARFHWILATCWSCYFLLTNLSPNLNLTAFHIYCSIWVRPGDWVDSYIHMALSSDLMTNTSYCNHRSQTFSFIDTENHRKMLHWSSSLHK